MQQMPLAPRVLAPQPTSACGSAAVDSPIQVTSHLVLSTPRSMCLSALFPVAFSDATGACSVPVQDSGCGDVNAPKLNPQPMGDRTQWINVPASCLSGTQFGAGWSLCMFLKWPSLDQILIAHSREVGNAD